MTDRGGTKRPSSRNPAFEPADRVQSADLEIRVLLRSQEGRRSLEYVLSSPSGRVPYRDHRIPGPRIETSLEDFRARLCQRLEVLAASSTRVVGEAARRKVTDELTALGQDLYRELFPPLLRRAYRHVRRRIRTLHILSEEPAIPWELVKPADDSVRHQLIDDTFLCDEFEMTRWLITARTPPDSISVRRLACVEAGCVNGLGTVVNAEAELRFLGDLARRRRVEDRSLPAATFPRLQGLLVDEDLDLLHFVGHGQTPGRDPDEVCFPLTDGGCLRPRDLGARLRSRIRVRRPFVFLNVCRAAQQGWSLTGLGGWVSRWISGCECGGFVGPLWSVDDAIAHRFAIAFYRALEVGESPAGAARTARRALREDGHDSPDGLAFAVYGCPGARVLLGEPGSHVRGASK